MENDPRLTTSPSPTSSPSSTAINATSPRVKVDRLRAELAKRSLAEFFRQGWHVLEAATPLAWSWHLDAICLHVQVVIEDWARRQTDPAAIQRVRDLLVSIGPGTAKSRVGVYAIPWAWLRWPTLRAICLSANPRVALRDSSYAREVIASPWYQQSFKPAWQIRSDEDSKGIFANTAGGSRSAIGMDARIVGTRADLLWIDDPHDPEEAQSDAQRRAVLERWDTSIANRVNDIGSSVRIGIAQRVHEDDWSSHRIAEGWTELMLPLEFEPDRACVTPIIDPATGNPWRDPRTVEGEVLHPDRFPPDEIAKLKKASGRFATLYQQRPAPAGGALVKTSWLRYWRKPGAPDASNTRPSGSWLGPAVELPAKMDQVVIAADLAMGKKTAEGDFNVIVALGKKGSDFYVLECWRARADFPEVQREFKAMARRHPNARKVVEQAAAGASLVASLQREVSGVIGVPPSGSKEQRMHAVLGFYEAGNVHLSESWPGLGDAVHELTTFPRGRHDDFVDALNLALSQLTLVVDDDYEEKRHRFIVLMLQTAPEGGDPATRRAHLEDVFERKAGVDYGPIRPEDESRYRLSPPGEVGGQAGYGAFLRRLEASRDYQGRERDVAYEAEAERVRLRQPPLNDRTGME